jgi:putative nucleotidyltransferase with HDIG domain
MSKQRILLADDEQTVRQLVGITLDDDAFQLCYARDGVEAIELARRMRPRLVLLDYQMPGLSGIEVCRALRADPSTAQASIVMLTGQGGEAVRALARDAGVDDFLTKPFSPLALEKTVRTMLARSPGRNGSHAPSDPTTESAAIRGLVQPAAASGLSREQLMIYAADLNRSMRKLREAHGQLQRSYVSTIEALIMALELRDAETRGHCHRVTLYTLAAARQMGITGEQLEQVHWGALLHDVGKIGVPDRVLLKPGALSPEEWEMMRRHPELGHQMLEAVPILTEALKIVRFHHERYAGGGYPTGRSGEDIPFGARLFAVADTLDAITADRPYRAARSWDEARAEVLRHRGTQFDPAVVDAYMDVFHLLPNLHPEHEPTGSHLPALTAAGVS